MKQPLVLLAALLLAPLAAQAQIPQTLDELWADFPQLDQVTPLETEVLKEWTQDGVVCRIVRYQVGVFQGAPARVAAFYAFPEQGTKLPALLSLHGGGQAASLDGVLADAQRGYAALSLNWGGNKLNFGRSPLTYDGPQTDWGRLDATHPPQRNKAHNHFAGSLTPDEFTLDRVESPRNSNWFVVLMAARRALTFLEQQPEVDPGRIGVYGHSMGGKLTTNLAGIDSRVKAAVPSCGGAGIVLESQTELPGCLKTTPTALELACISDNAYIPRITCPMLWLSPTNDFHAPVGNMAWNWGNLPDERTRFSISPHLNHRHADEYFVTQHLWFEQHLKDAFQMPRTPTLALNLQTPDGVPRVTVTPDDSQPVQRVDVYYSIDPDERTRFWRDALAVQDGTRWTAACPVMTLEQPLFVYASVIYELPEAARHIALPPGHRNTEVFALSSRVRSAAPAELRAAGVQATDCRQRMIDDGSRGWHDWYRLNWDHPPLWQAVMRKPKDPKWRGPDGAKLVFEVRPEADSTLVIKVSTNDWGAFAAGQPAANYVAVTELPGGSDWQTVSVGLDDLTATDPNITKPLTNWQTVTELSISPSGEIVRDGQKQTVGGQPWRGPRDIRNLRWEGGE
jgi:dienelactone hydrolase